MGTENLNKIFNPRRIAVIGASNREGSIGAKILQNLIGVGYKGVVYPVNPFRTTVQGITAYPSITKIPWQVDLAVIATPAHTIPQIVDECGKAGVLGIIIISAGFKEVGEEGKTLEKQILKLKTQYDMRIIGPNSFGFMRPKIKLNTTFANKPANPGNIAFLSQSAALCASVLESASEAYIGFSALVSTGSMLDVDLGDLIDYFGTDPQTRSILMYIEGITDARKFMSAARRFARTKPIIVVKAGKFPESAKAAASHTGTLTGEDKIYDAAFKRAGIVRVDKIADLFNCAEVLDRQPLPKGPKLTIITNAGAPGIMATDFLIANNGALSPLNHETIRVLKNIVPPYCSVKNPIDILEEATPERFRKVMEIIFKDPNSDGFLVIYTPQGATDAPSIAQIIIETSKETKKPILTALLGEGDCLKARRILQKNGILAFSTPEQAVSSFLYMFSYTQNLELLYQTPEELSIELSVPPFLREMLGKACREGRKILNLPESFQFLEAYKIPTIKTLVAKTEDEAETAASKLGYPVVMKALSPQITHKSKAKGVILNVWSPTKVRAFYHRLARNVKKHHPQANFQGVVIQPMLQQNGYELLLGSKKDPQFGSVIVFGTGGVTTELCKDVNIGLPPLNQVLARRLMEKTAIYQHWKSRESSYNLKLLDTVLLKFSQLVIDFPEIKEVDINPIIFDGESALAVDARVVIDTERILRGTQPYEHLVIAPYPKKYVTQWKLKNGTPATLRPIKAEDEIYLQELFASLSEKTMRFRFFQTIKKISHETLTKYCNLDYARELAMVAEVHKDKDKKRIIGVARLTLDPDGKHGEYAVVIGDQWHDLGLGSKMTDYMIEIGKERNLQTIYGYVMPDNSKMLHLCIKKGFKIKPLDDETSEATLDLS